MLTTFIIIMPNQFFFSQKVNKFKQKYSIFSYNFQFIFALVAGESMKINYFMK